jgi:hypothetical protein
MKAAYIWQMATKWGTAGTFLFLFIFYFFCGVFCAFLNNGNSKTPKTILGEVHVKSFLLETTSPHAETSHAEKQPKTQGKSDMGVLSFFCKCFRHGLLSNSFGVLELHLLPGILADRHNFT